MQTPEVLFPTGSQHFLLHQLYHQHPYQPINILHVNPTSAQHTTAPYHPNTTHQTVSRPHTPPVSTQCTNSSSPPIPPPSIHLIHCMLPSFPLHHSTPMPGECESTPHLSGLPVKHDRKLGRPIPHTPVFTHSFRDFCLGGASDCQLAPSIRLMGGSATGNQTILESAHQVHGEEGRDRQLAAMVAFAVGEVPLCLLARKDFVASTLLRFF